MSDALRPWLVSRRAALVLAIAAVYFAAAKLGFTMAFAAEQVSPAWPPTGIALAALLVLGRDAWPGVALGALLANATTSAPVWTAFAIAAGNTLEAVIGAELLRRSDFQRSLGRLRDVLALVVLAALLSTTVSATIGVATLCRARVYAWGAFPSLWWTWWIGDAMGDLVVAPLLLVWSRSFERGVARRPLVEAAALVAVLLVVELDVFGGRLGRSIAEYPLQYTVFPIVVWSALRFGQRGTTLVTFVAASFATWATAHGAGPFALGNANESLIMLQLFMAVMGVTALLLGAVIAERNVAERRHTADYERLEVGQERLRLALDAGRMGVWDWNIETGELSWTAQLEPLHGLAPGTFGGTFAAFREVVHPDDRAALDHAIARAVEEGTGFEIEFRNPWPDGTMHWIAGKGRALRDATGRAVRMIGVGLDMTEHRRLEQELRRQAQELADADRRKDEFLAMLAHELRNPLAPLVNAAAILRAQQSDPAVVESACALVERQVRHIARLVEDLLDVARISSGKIALRRERAGLAAVVETAVEISRPLIDARRHRLAIRLPPEPLHVDGDPTRLAQVLANLLDNAAKYTEAGGEITLTAARAGEEAVVRVRDTGMGMSPQMVERAFDLFAQGERTLERTESGLGIGLTLVRSLVELHGGRVTASSEGPGRGSEITVRLPALPAAAAGAIPAPAAVAVVARRVLVVDDNVDGAESAAMLLKLDGHDVRVAHTGPDALAVAHEFVPDVVVLDIGLPGMDGYAVARALREDRVVAHVRLIAVTGYGRDDDRRRAQAAGFDDHLVKPVDIETLSALLATRD